MMSVGTTFDRERLRWSRTSPSIGRGGVGIKQPFAFELTPKLHRDSRRQTRDVLFDFVGTQRSRDHRAQGRMGQRELHCGRAELDTMTFADRLDLLCLV